MGGRNAAEGKRGDLLAFVPAGDKAAVYDYDDAKPLAGLAAWYTLEAIDMNGAVIDQATESVIAATTD